MIETLRKFADFFEGKDVKIKIPSNYKKIKNIIMAGMGASALPAQVIKEGVEINLPFEISKNYNLPGYADKNTLLICISRSGNTKETLSQFNQGLKKRCKIIAISCGGELKNVSEKIKIPFIEIPKEFADKETRETFSNLIFILIKILKVLDLTKENLYFSVLQNEANIIEKDTEVLAKKIKDYFPIVLSEYSSVSFRWESEISENSKKLSESEALPEFVHNKIVSWEELNQNYCIVFLRDDEEQKEIKILIESIKKIIANKVPIFEIYGKGKNKLEKMIYLIWFGDFVSYFIAKEKNIDPKETKYIRILKEEIKKAS